MLTVVPTQVDSIPTMGHAIDGGAALEVIGLTVGPINHAIFGIVLYRTLV